MRRASALALAALVLGAPQAASAATPASGAPTGQKPSVKWSGFAAGGIVNVVQPVRDMTCEQPFCDTYALTVPADLPEGTTLRLEITAQQATGFVMVNVHDPSGTRTLHQTGSGEPKLTVELEAPEAGVHTIETYTNTLFVPGLSEGPYTGRATLVLPPLPQPAG